MKIKIVHLYPDLLNLYGDKGNIECLRYRLLWRDIEAEVTEVLSDEPLDISEADIIFLGGGSDREQKIVLGKLMEHRDKLREYTENGGSLLAVCGGYELLAKSCEIGGEKKEALGILDCRAVSAKERFTDNVVLQSEIVGGKITGFENHSGRMDIGGGKPLGKVLCGNGNDGRGAEGMVYKNVVATYLYGPLLPKNPKLCDYILTNALKHKYPEFERLRELDDLIEIRANDSIVSRFVK